MLWSFLSHILRTNFGIVCSFLRFRSSGILYHFDWQTFADVLANYSAFIFTARKFPASETSVKTAQSTRRYIPEDLNLQEHHQDSIKSHRLLYYSPQYHPPPPLPPPAKDASECGFVKLFLSEKTRVVKLNVMFKKKLTCIW